MIRVLIIEDEQIAADNLEKHLNNIDSTIQVLNKIESIRDSVSWLSQNSADLIFSDIHLSDGLCFSIFEQIEVNIPVIFTTAYDKYALKAFKLYSIDYLLKPIEVKELKSSIAKFKKIVNPNLLNIDIQTLVDSFKKVKDYQKRFVINVGQKIRIVKTRDIAFFNGSDSGTFLTTFSNQSYSVDFSLDRLETILDPENYFRINRNFIVNIDAIKDMYTLAKSRFEIVLNPDPKQETRVSFNRMSNFRKWINR